MFIDLHTLRTKIKIRNTTTNNIEFFFTLINTTNKNVILIAKKKKTAHAYFERLLFLSFLAGKLRHFEQLLLIASKNKTGACVF